MSRMTQDDQGAIAMTDDLIARIEAASADDERHMLELAWQQVRGEFPGGCAWYSAENQRLARLLNGGGFIDAALTLVPDDAFWRLGHDGDGADPSEFKAQIIVPKLGGVDMRGQSVAATPALALCAAALKARKAQP